MRRAEAHQKFYDPPKADRAAGMTDPQREVDSWFKLVSELAAGGDR